MPGVLLPAASPDALASARRSVRLQRAAAHARDPFALPVLNPPPAYAASTGYVAGTVVASNGNWYVAVSAGTSPAVPAPAPAHVSASAVSDGAVLWTYLGPASALNADVAMPVVSVSTGVPALGNVFGILGANAVAGAVRPLGGYVYSYGGYPGLYTLNRAAGQPTGTHVGWEFETDEPQVAIGVFGRAAPVQLVIDGRRHSPGGLTMPASGENWITIAFPAGERQVHRVRIEFATATMAIKDVRVSANGQVWAPAADTIRALFVSDSLCAGSSFSPFVAGGSLPWRIAAAMGWGDPWNCSIGGTGYVATGAGYYTYGQRIPEALTRTPDIWVLMGSTNDSGQPAATITAAALATYRAIRAGSTAPIVVLGVWPKDGAAAATETAVQAAVAQFADPLTIFVPICGDASGLPWLTGSWNNAGHTGSTNAALLLGGDGTHPVDGGAAYLARRAAAAIRRQVLPRL